MANGNRAILLVLMALLAFPLAAQAQINDDDIEERKKNLPEFVDDSNRLEVSLSYVLQSVKTNLHHIEGGEESVNSANQARNQLELTIGYYFTRYKTFGLEVVTGYTQAGGQVQKPNDFTDPDNPVVFPLRELEHSVYHVGGNFVYNLGNLEFVPFLYAGGGVEFFDVPDDSSYPFDGSYPYANVGLGLKYFHAEWIGGVLRLEDRFHFMDDAEEGQGNLNQFRLAIGAVVTF